MLLVIEDDTVNDNDVAQFQAPLTDLLIHSEIYLPQGEEIKCAKVLLRSKNDNDEIVGTYNENPILNTLVYDVEFPDGDVREYRANIIVENTYAQVDADRFAHTLVDHNSDYRKDGNAIDKADSYVVTKRAGNACGSQLMDGF